MNLSLIGLRGVGKSNVARRLSVMAKRTVLSTDVLIEYESGGRTIPELVAPEQGGWRAFREREYDVIRKVARMRGLIVDCGGGVVVDLDEGGNEVFSDRKVSLLRASGLIIWLAGDITRLAAKTAGGAERPELDTTRTAEEIMRRRVPFYEAAADVTFDLEGRTRADIAEEIFAVYGDRLLDGSP